MFEEKLKEAWPIRDISKVVHGKEWNELVFLIKEKIVGREKYEEASEQKNKLGKHIVEMLDQMGYLSYSQTSRVIHKLYSSALEHGAILESISKIKIEKDKDNKNKVRFLYGNSEVDVCWIPSIKSKKLQLIVKYDEYMKFQNLIKNNDTNPLEKKSRSIDFKFEDIVSHAYKDGVSDIHITFGDEYYNVFFRISGRLEKQQKYLMRSEDGFEFLKGVKIEAAEFTKGKFNTDVHFLGQDAKVSYANVGLDGVDVRLAFMPDGKLTHMCLTARILKREKLSNPDFSSMGYGSKLVKKIDEVSRRKNGLVVASGITGSGKSTFISNMVAGLDKQKRIITVEDPIEYQIIHPNTTQHQVYEPKSDKEGKDKQGFKEYTKLIKRSDPDAVYIGEMRNEKELTDSIIEMSEAGQLVFSTAHLTSAFSIYASFEQIFNISSRLSIPLILFSINQVLVDKLCDDCKVEDKEKECISTLKKSESYLPYVYKQPLKKLFEDAGEITFYKKGDGCDSCMNSGFKGRAPVYEYFAPNVDFMEWLVDKPTTPLKYAVEREACERGIGVNKLETFIELLKNGVVDTSDDIMDKIK